MSYKHIEIYIKSKPKLLITAVILFSLIWSVIGPFGGCEKLIFHYLHKDAYICRNQGLIQTKQPNQEYNPSFLSANVLGVLVAESQDDLSNGENKVSGNGEDTPNLVQASALLSNAGPVTFVTQEARDEVIYHIVQEDEVPSTIAATYGISTYTLLWANKLSDGSIIRPGDELVILPTSGILHRVKDGDTVGVIAKKYEAEESDVIAFNDLPADGSITIGQEIVVPDGVMPAPVKPKATYVAAAASSVSGPGTGKSRSFPYGQCTWYVAQKRYVPWNGHAKSWLANAQAMGYPVCWGSQCEPRAGAIISLTGGNWLSRLYGHVAYVESVSDGWFTISEMNHAGWAVRSVRTISNGSGAIAGFIY